MISEKAVLSRILLNNEWANVVDKRISREIFQDETAKACYMFIEDFYSKYGSIPSIDLVEQEFDSLKLTYAKEPVDYYLDKVVENYIRVKGSEILLKSARGLLQDPMKGVTDLQGSISELTLEAVPTRDDVIDDTIDSRKERYLRLKSIGGMDGMPTPWEVLNEATMGLHEGDFISIVSRPGVGKSWFLTIFAEYAARLGFKVLFVTNEMSNTQIMQRFDAIYFKLPYKEFRAGLLPDVLEERYFKGLEEMKGKVDVVVTQDVQGVNSIGSKIDQYKPDLVLIDGMYLLLDDQKSTNKWEGITNISRNLKRMAIKKKVPILATTQFNRAAEEIKIDRVTLSNLGFSDSIGQDADVVLGLFRTKDMEMNDELKVRMLKVREGEPKDFMLQWDLRRMDFKTLELSDDDSYLPEELDEGTISY